MKRGVLLLFAVLYLSVGQVVSASIDVAILTGHTDKHHSWELMSGCVQSVVQSYDAMQSEIILYSDESTFSPDFAKYDVVVVNLNETQWSDSTRRNFEEYVERGGGVVIIHEADNAFADWAEYNQMIGLGGWGGRTKSAGAYYYFQDGEFVRDTITDFKSGHHGRRVTIDIEVRAPKHPIMKGLPLVWQHHNDELYSYMRGPAENMEVLATAYSDPATGGSGREEPVLFTVRYGKGRIFHTVLGHTATGFTQAIDNIGFQTTLLRGVEWAATGKVKCGREEVE